MSTTRYPFIHSRELVDNDFCYMPLSQVSDFKFSLQNFTFKCYESVVVLRVRITFFHCAYITIVDVEHNRGTLQEWVWNIINPQCMHSEGYCSC